MKRLLLILCLTASGGLCLAQSSVWKCHSPEECVTLVDSLIKVVKHEYQPDSLRFPELDRKRYAYWFIEKDSTAEEPRRLSITFRYYMEGEDQTLEIEGTPTYRIAYIQGAYLDLFPMWKGWINPDADLHKIASDGSVVGFIGPKDQFDRYIFEKMSDRRWRIYK